MQFFVALLLSAVQVSAANPAAAPARITARIPGHEATVALDAPGFVTSLARESADAKAPAPAADGKPAADEKPAKDAPIKDERILFAGQFAGARIVLAWDENFPYQTAADGLARWSEEQGFTTFTVATHPACRFRDATGELVFRAYPTTNEWRFELEAHVPVSAKDAKESKNEHTLDQAAFEKLLASFELTGKPSDAGRLMPPALYAIRDQSVLHADESLEWIAEQCMQRPNAWEVYYYLGTIARRRQKLELVVKGFARATELLTQMEKRTPKEEQARVGALDSTAWGWAAQRHFAEALPFVRKLLETTRPDPGVELTPTVRRFREQAHYNLAVCLAQTGKAREAVEALRLALSLRPDFRERAQRDTTLRPLHEKLEFRELVGLEPDKK